MDVTKLCRACMKEVASWEKENFDPKAVEMFCFCTNIRITEEDRLPKQFCYDCIIKMESSYTFITEAQKVNVTLKNIISRTNTVIVEPESSKIKIDMKLTLPKCKISSIIETDSRVSNIAQSSTRSIENDYNLDDTIIQDDETPDPKENIEAEVKNTIVCKECKKGFVTKTWYDKHVQKAHSGKKYVCAHCPKSFPTASRLSYHSASHSDKRNYSCTICGKKFKHRRQLHAHKPVHKDAKPYTCDICSARFKLKTTLRGHMKVHEERKSFLCSFCGVSFAQAGNLTVHIRTHTGERPFTCGECGFRARVASNLRRHARIHAHRPAHACHCGKAFNDASNLVRHRRTHTGELPYKCPLCASCFSDSWKRKTHLMRTHKMALHDIPRMRSDGRIVVR